MAEAIVSAAIKTMADLLTSEAKFLYGVSDEVGLLQVDLRQMQSFLRDAEDRQQENERIRNWITEIREIAYDAEDIIQTFVLNASGGLAGTEGVSFLKRFICVFSKASDLHELGTQIQSLRAKMKAVSEGMKTYGIIRFSGEGDAASHSRSQHHEVQQLRRTYPHKEEEDVISLEGCMRDLKAQLLTEEDRLRVVSVVGMGGLGKTTLAKKVYNNKEVRRRFDCHCWAFISQQFSLKDVLLEILKQLVEDRNKWMEMEVAELVKNLHDLLKERRFLVVVDDIWSKEAWSSLKNAFPIQGRRGSKVLFTTRIKEVALHADPRSSPIEPPFLSNEESWTLFCKKAFPREAPEFEKLGKEMVNKCGGLPLAIVVLGGLLATKQTKYEWEVVHRNMNIQLSELDKEEQYGGVYGILALSYQALPAHLKPCFLYLSQFPEDWEINMKRLIRMWIAEGFIPLSSSNGGGGEEEMVEDVGERYLGELMSRCMIQVGERNYTGMGVRTCRMHDLMRDMCVSKAREENFLGVVKHHGVLKACRISCFSSFSLQLTVTSSDNSRRTAIHCQFGRGIYGKFAPLLQGNPCLRSLVYFVGQGNSHFMKIPQHGFILNNLRLLRVLSLDNIIVSEGKLSGEIGNLIYLRYLGLRSCYLSRVPASIGNLRSLYTLDLRGNSIEKFPNVLWKLGCLRHLKVNELIESSFRRFQVDTLKHLETLRRVDARILIRKNAHHKLTNLRHLGITFERREVAEKVLNSPIFRLGLLRSLFMKGIHQNLEPLSHCHHLSKLRLHGKIVENDALLPPHNNNNLQYLPPSLEKLTLILSRLKQDPMPILEKLPNLRYLSMEYRSYNGSEMVCSAHGFPQLEFLQLKSAFDLEEWRVEEGAMPCLTTLNINDLKKLRMVPEGFKFLTTLRQLNVQMPMEFSTRIEVVDGIQGEDFYKVRHIPSITIIPTTL